MKAECMCDMCKEPILQLKDIRFVRTSSKENINDCIEKGLIYKEFCIRCHLKLENWIRARC